MANETTLSGQTSHTGLLSEESSTRNVDSLKQLGSWRFTVRAGVAVAAVVFLVNLGALIWALTLGVQDASATVFEGRASDVEKSSLLPHHIERRRCYRKAQRFPD